MPNSTSDDVFTMPNIKPTLSPPPAPKRSASYDLANGPSGVTPPTPTIGKGLPTLPTDIAGTITGQTLTPSQDINSYLKTYANELSSLGPEYSKEMEYLAPYLTGGSPNSTNDSQASSIGKSISSGVQSPNLDSPLNNALQSSENTLGQATEAQTPAITKLFNDASKAVSGPNGYESTIPYSDVLSSALAYGKSQLTYSGVGANTQGWAPEMQSLYSYLAGAAGIGGVGQPGAPTVTEAQLGAPTSATATPAPPGTANDTLTAGGNG